MDPSFSRRQFLLGGSAVLLGTAAACSKKSKVIKVDQPSGDGGSTAVSLVVATYIHTVGIDQRVTVAFIAGDSPTTPSGPVELTFRDPSGQASAPVRAEAHHDGPDTHDGKDGQGLPYFMVRHQFDNAGIYTVESKFNGKVLTAPVQVTAPSATGVPTPGLPMISVPSPTVADANGVNPICTREPVCPLHDVSLDAALAEGRPLAVLFATPLLCQSRLCGPTLDNLLTLRDEFAGKVRFLHMEIYTDTSGKTTAPVVNAYHLENEPFLFLAAPDGTVFDRLDNAVDVSEMRAALRRLAP